MQIGKSEKSGAKTNCNNGSDTDSETNQSLPVNGIFWLDTNLSSQGRIGAGFQHNYGSKLFEHEPHRVDKGGLTPGISQRNLNQKNLDFAPARGECCNPQDNGKCSRSVLKDLSMGENNSALRGFDRCSTGNKNDIFTDNNYRVGGTKRPCSSTYESKPKRIKLDDNLKTPTSFEKENLQSTSNQPNISSEGQFDVVNETFLEHNSTLRPQNNFNSASRLSNTFQSDYYDYVRNIVLEKFKRLSINDDDIKQMNNRDQVKKETEDKQAFNFNFVFDLYENDSLFVVRHDAKESISHYVKSPQTGRSFLLVPNQNVAKRVSEIFEQAGRRCIILIGSEDSFDSSILRNGKSTTDITIYYVNSKENTGNPSSQVTILSQCEPYLGTTNLTTESDASTHIPGTNSDKCFKGLIGNCDVSTKRWSESSSTDKSLRNFELRDKIQDESSKCFKSTLTRPTKHLRSTGMLYEHSQAGTETFSSKSLLKGPINVSNLTKPQYVSNHCGNTNSHRPTYGDKLRPIIIDGWNVAFQDQKFFSVRRLFYCIDYFVRRGHKVKAFVPQIQRIQRGGCTDLEFLKALNKAGLVGIIPSHFEDGRDIVYQDEYILQCASLVQGVVVTRKTYHHLYGKYPAFDDIIRSRLLMHTWVNNYLIFPCDPLGRDGPTLEEFLKFPDKN